MSVLYSSGYIHELEISQQLCRMGRIFPISKRRKPRIREAGDTQILCNYKAAKEGCKARLSGSKAYALSLPLNTE